MGVITTTDVQNNRVIAPIPAVAYIRVSTLDQEKKETQVNQEKAIFDYATRNNFTIVKTFSDLAISGNENDRPYLDAMLDMLTEIKHVIFFDQSRLSRNFEFSMKLMFMFQKLNVKVHLASENRVLDYNDDTMQLITSIQSWAAAQERKMIKNRQKIGIERYREKNKRWGPRKIEISMKKVNELLAAGVSKAAIARIFEISRTTLLRRIKEIESKQ